MGLVKQIEIRQLESIKGGMAEFYTPQSSHETMLVQVPAGTIDDLFVHHFQTDQLLVVRGSFVLVVLLNRSYQYIPLSEEQPVMVRIPPGIPHGAINLSNKPCVLVNAVLRHGKAHERDYQPLKRPFPYDLEEVKARLVQFERPAIV
ncbi:MAG: dTDP-4-dehydrorhamnose 3,5-epimerase [Symploca sp. SIO3C6]|uniref:dTDP-4-dehydrorhamnose 3,5-epimerase n=1 Tax=Symploca sp. SIO1C4 TaxID=2607765 RepID=A0A6B3NBU1_9CYAN|nr:dTDP-4-dehydrorhamnose 3,5-epimerase [Symploca sp. SIO3C6]NER27514.1 dTDP-4-dehydrorhamnose 3,5-epimerase [Symploca sp. SIO1C4]NET03920.1 dTDP-4-dehydrorhamnose 3,5-epimerase [Symploca sp. SIO2B6]